MDEYGADSRDICGLKGAQYGVAQQIRAEVAALIGPVDGRQHDRYYRTFPASAARSNPVFERPILVGVHFDK